jgi:phenylpropionate dioxygenase-like ring-hydroxylating dioxygenase large terminal subunit
VGNVDVSDRGLIELPCIERGGLLFGALDPFIELDIDQFYGTLIEEISRIDYTGWHIIDKYKLYGANWKLTFDGYLENYHFPFAHKNSLALTLKSNLALYRSSGPHLHFFIGNASIGEMGNIDPSQRWRMEGRNFHQVLIFYPNASFMLDFDGIASLALILPGESVGQHHTLLYHLSRDEPIDDEQRTHMRAVSQSFRDVILKEDYEMGGRIQRGVGSDVSTTIMFGRNEPANQYFHRWITYMTGGERPQAPSPEL